MSALHSRSLQILLCGLLALIVVGAVAPGAGSPPPRPVCGACGDAFESTAAAHGLEVSVERSTATVTVDGDGTATWTVRNHLATGAEPLRGDPARRAEVGEAAAWDTTFLGASVSGDVVTLRYRDPDFAARSVGGVLRSGTFTEAYGYRNLAGLGADRLTVVAPEGAVVDWALPGATVSDDGTRMTLTSFERAGFVTFVPRSSALGPLWSALAVASLLGPTVVLNAFVRIGLPAATVGLLVGAAGGLLSWLDRDFGRVRESAGAGLAAAGGLVTLLVLAVGGVSVLGGAAAPVVGLGVALIALGVALSRRPVQEAVSYRALVGGAALAVLVACGATVAAAIVTDQTGLTRALLTSLPPLVPVFALLPAGYALGRDRRGLAVGTAVGGLVIALLPSVSLLAPGVGVGLLAALVATALAAGLVLLGSPLLLVGVALGRRDGARA